METVKKAQGNKGSPINKTVFSMSEMSENFTNELETMPGRGESILTRTQYHLSIEIQGMILIVVASFGVVTNIINIKTFITMGAITDGVTSTFMFLAVSDAMMCCAAIAASLGSILISRESRWLQQFHLSPPAASNFKKGFLSPVDPSFIAVLSVSMMQMFSIVTISITVYLAVARCLCVVQPLRFRNSISVRKTMIFVSTVFVLSLLSRLPSLAHVRVSMLFDGRFNSSRPTLTLLPEREVIKDATWLSVDITSCVGAQITLVVCIGIMLNGLRVAAEFRSNASRSVVRLTNSVAKERTASHSGVDNLDTDAGKTSTKETRIAKQMVFVSTIFIVCNTPKMISYLTTNIEPDFDLGGRYQYLYQYSISLFAIFDTLNSSSNIFVYFKYNTKFRNTFFRTK